MFFHGEKGIGKGLKGVLAGVSCAAGLLLLFSLFLSSCSSEEQEGVWIRNGRRTGRREVFRKLKDYSVALIVMSPRRTYLPGSANAKIIFALKNTGHTKLTIKEWRMNEKANLRILYAPGTPEETKNLPPGKWKISPTFDPADKYAEVHNPLTLNPVDNKALIEVPLTFIRDVKNMGKKQYFTIVAELNLTSISARSEPVLITVK
ncbi:MAG: hypothetical protein J6331_06785 [Lentisphaeria bacterium]|nr:hypothetical protein [Lentisphaeria bacterium]